jgi:hypothetical protein
MRSLYARMTRPRPVAPVPVPPPDPNLKFLEAVGIRSMDVPDRHTLEAAFQVTYSRLAVHVERLTPNDKSVLLEGFDRLCSYQKNGRLKSLDFKIDRAVRQNTDTSLRTFLAAWIARVASNSSVPAYHAKLLGIARTMHTMDPVTPTAVHALLKIDAMRPEEIDPTQVAFLTSQLQRLPVVLAQNVATVGRVLFKLTCMHLRLAVLACHQTGVDDELFRLVVKVFIKNGIPLTADWPSTNKQGAYKFCLALTNEYTVYGREAGGAISTLWANSFGEEASFSEMLDLLIIAM